MHQNSRTTQKVFQTEAVREWDHQSAPSPVGPEAPLRGEPTGAARRREQAIRELAYAKWEEAGRPPGDGVQFWLAAERELKR
ncbi:MAG TPA: DUF2934 domain-containing protein [Fimbriiglobus sp.]|nr:DUF2934 domain-containing protein [Fimbriiglobus sp.]